MKRLWLLCALILLCGVGAAAPIDEQQARKVAEEFFGATHRSAPLSLHRVVPLSMAPVTEQEPAYYIFNNTARSGFVVVAGDDRAQPVLGYSLENTFPTDGELPPNVRDWLESIRRQIADCDALEQRGMSFSTSESGYGEVVVSYETALWDQVAPYCYLMPAYEGYYCITGCTATAVAIVMKYHEWPAAGSGTLAAYTTTNYGISVPEVELGHTYSWSDMLMDYSAGYDNTQAQAVATLMRDCSVMLQSDMSPYATGASPSNIIPAITKYMDYDASAMHRYANYFNTSEWIGMVKRSLDKGLPVLYFGYNDVVGHAFVLDGYTTNDYFSVNWGWSGYCNGYFRLQAMVPDGSGSGGNDDHYNLYQEAVFELKPDEGGSSIDHFVFVPYEIEGVLYRGITSPSSSFEVGQPFDVQIGLVVNYSYSSFSREIGLLHCGADEQVKDTLVEIPLSGLEYGWGFYYNFGITLTEPIEAGDFLALGFRRTGETNWTFVGGNEEAGCQPRLLLDGASAPQRTLAQSVAFSYRVEERTIYISSLEGNLQWNLTDSDLLNSYGEVASVEQGRLVLQTEKLAAGDYLFHFWRGEEYINLPFRVGEGEPGASARIQPEEANPLKKLPLNTQTR